MPPRPARKQTGAPAAPRKPAGKTERIPPKAQGAGEAAKAAEAPVPVKEQSKGVVVPERVAGSRDSSANGSGAGNSQWDTSKPFMVQFGSINPGLMNGMQIPARTSSAPPNLDEQKKDQVRRESFRAVPAMSIPSVPKVQPPQPRKDVGSAKPSSVETSQAPTQLKRDVHVPIPSGPVGAPPKPANVLPPMASMPTTIPFQHQQSQVPLQFGGPNPQMHPQGLSASTLQIPMALPVGSASQVTQQIFIPSHHHVLQQQAMIHQGQGLGFLPPGHQLAPQLGSLGMGIVPQFPQHQPNKLSGPRKTAVKITHPDTHEELRLDKRTDSFKDATSSVQRSMPNAPVQSPHVAAAYPPSTQYYAAAQPNSYNASQLLFPTLHVPLSSGQLPTGSQAPRYPHPVSQSGGAQIMRGVEAVNFGGPSVSTPAPSSVQVTVKPPPTSQVEKGKSSVTISKPISKVETARPLKVAADAAVSQRRNESAAEPVENASKPVAAGSSLPVLQGNEGNRREPVRRTDSFKDNQNKSYKKDNKYLLHSHQTDANNFADNANAFSTKTINDTKVGDGNLQEPSSNCESEQPQVASTLATSSGLSSQEVHCSTPDAGLSGTVEIKQGHEQSVSSTVLLQKAKLDVPLVSKPEPISGADGVSVRETEESAVLVSSGHLIGTVQNKFDAGVIQENDNFNSVGVVDAARNENVDVPKELPRDLHSTKEHSVSLNESSEKASVVSLAGQNDDALGLVGKAEQYENVVNKELRNSMPGVYSADQIDRKEGDHISNKPMELIDAESASSSCAPYASSVKNENLIDNLETEHEVSLQEDKVPSVFSMTSPDFASESTLSQVVQKVGDNVVLSGGVPSITSSGPKEMPTLESLKPKVTAVKKKKKIKEILSKADAAGTSDLYNAYKGPEEKPEVVTISESANSSLQTGEVDVAVDDFTNGVVTSQQDGQNKSELDDWEDAADISTPRLRATNHEQPINAESMQHDEDGVTGRKKYSKDFLLTLSHQFTGLPQGFEIGSDIANALMSVPVAKQHIIDLDSYASTGMIIDRSGAPRVDHRAVSNMNDDKWIRSPGPIGAGHDPRLDVGYGVAVVSLRPGQGANHGVLRNQRGHPSNNFIGGILSGPQTGVPQGGTTRSNSDADRWQKATVAQRGLIPSPQGPMQVMHKAEKKYEIGKINDEESAKQRQLKAILNKLTPQNFEKLFAQVLEVNIDNPVTLTGVISQIFDKALMEPTFCEMYANFCHHLSNAIPDFVEGSEKITFKRLLLNKCQEEFERGEREQAEANRVEEEGEIKQSEEEREEKRIRARRRMLGNIRLIGELYKKKMLTERIMHECIKKLLGQGENPDEEDIESLCKLMSTIGEIIDHPKAKEHMDAYFEQMTKLSTNQKLSPRVRFLLRDTIDLRKNKWQQRIKVEGPKKIDEVHRDAAQERHGQGSRSMRGPTIGSIPRRGPAIEYGLRGPNPLTSPGSQQVAGIRGMPPQIRSYAQDVHFDGRQQFDSRSLPLPQRSICDDSITLGPQGGLARGMSIRGQPLMHNVPTAETLGGRDFRRTSSGQNGYNPSLDSSSSFNSRESRMMERTFDRSASIPPPSGRARVASGSIQLSTSEVEMSEDRLKEKSMLAVKEYYSSKDMQELVLCVQDLNAPSYYPTMISQWVTDSFERKDLERDLLAKLIVNLCKPHDSLLGPGQLMQGFEHVLSLLEDAVTDAPKAVEFLGRIFAATIVENVIPFSEVGRLILKGGEEPGQLLESGLAAEVLGSILESIRSEKGKSVLDKIRVSSKLRLEDFRPPDGTKSKKLEAFL